MLENENILKQARLRKGWTMRDLEEQSKVTIKTISRLENGKQPASVKTVSRLAKALEVEIETLLPLMYQASEIQEKNRLAVQVSNQTSQLPIAA